MIGAVKWFSAQKGFGFIAGDDGNDYFAHFTDIAGTGYRTLEADQRVEFTATAESKGLRATNIVVLDDAPLLVFKG